MTVLAFLVPVAAPHVSGVSYVYDAGSSVAIADAHGAEASPARRSVAREWSTSSSVQAERGSMTSSDATNATESEYVNLASKSRTSHILDGDVRSDGSFGGGHRPGTGFPDKSEFPAGWSDDRIMHEISDVATDPSISWRPGRGSSDWFVNGTRGNIDIEVLIRNGEIWTGYPTNVLRNPP